MLPQAEPGVALPLEQRKQRALVRAIQRLSVLALTDRHISSVGLAELDAVLTRLEAPGPPSPRAEPTLDLLGVFKKDAIGKILWHLLPFKGVNAARSRGRHPLEVASRAWKSAADNHLWCFSEDELAAEVTQRWAKYEAELSAARAEWQREAGEVDRAPLGLELVPVSGVYGLSSGEPPLL